MAKEIKFNVRLTIDGKEQLGIATTDVSQLRDAIEASKTSAQRLTDTFIHFNQGVEVARNLSDAFSYFSNNLRDTAQQSRDVTTLTGKTGEEMQHLRNGVLAVAEYFGKDFNEVLRSVNSLANGFGVSMDEALELVRSGLVSGADVGGDFLDTLREYPRYFKEAGLSAENFVAITANAAKQGVFSDKGVDVIKEGNLRIREMTKATADALNGIGISADLVQQQLRNGSITTFEVMQQVAAKLRELPPSASQVGTAIADIFGGPGEDAGLEYIKTLADVKLSMDDVKAATNGVAEQQERQIKMQEQIKNAMSSIIDLSGVYADMKPYLDVASQAGFAVVGISNLVSTVKALNIASKAHTFANYVLSFLACAGNARKAAVATNMMTLAARSNAAAVTSATVAVRGFMAATVVGAALAALTWAINELISSFNGVDDAAEKAADGVDDVSESFENAKQAYDSTLKSTFGDLMSRFNGLRAQWKALATEQQKTDWIRKNADAFNDLGLKIENAADAEAIFNGNTDTIVEAFTRRAKAAAYAAELTELYGEKLKLTERKNAAQKASYETRLKQMGDNSIANKDNPYASQIQQRERNIAAIGADLRHGGDGNIADLDKKLKATDERIAYVEEQMRKNMPTTVIGKGKGGHGAAGTAGASPAGAGLARAAYDRPAETGSMDWYEKRLADIRKEIQATGDAERAKTLQAEYESVEEEFKDFKISIGLDEPEEKEAKTYVGKLQEQLSDAQKNFDNATTIEARVEAQARIDDIQAEIDEAVRGRLTIEADVEPQYVVQGSAEDKRQSYGNARQRADRIQQDYEIGLIGKDEALADLAELNAQVAALGLKPVHIEVETEDLDRAREKTRQTQDALRDGWGGIKGIGDGIRGITDALEGNAGAWQKITSVVDGTIQTFQSIMAVVGLIRLLTGATDTQTISEGAKAGATAASATAMTAAAAGQAAQAAASVPVIAANKALTASYMELASAMFFAAHASIPFAGFGIASGFASAAKAFVAAMGATPFAQGGVVSGPTLALVGEYAGAANNPEVIAPLDKLRSMLQPQGAAAGGSVRFEIDGRKLVGVLANETRVSGKSGRRTGIRI